MKYGKTSIAITAAVILGATAVIAAPGQGRGKADTNGDGMVTKSEMLAAAATKFAKLDANSDGSVDSADRDAMAKKRFDKMDADGNGAITEAEFKAGHEARKAERQGEGRGHWGMRGGKHGGGKGMAMLRNADVNGDQAVSRDEFLAAAEARFAKADANGDGNVTKEERKAMREKMREERGQGRPGRGES